MPYATPEKRREGRKRSYPKNRERILRKEREYRAANPEDYMWRTHYMRRYGITVEQFKGMIVAQGNRCGICQEEFKPRGKRYNRTHVDHCHDTGRIRGLLCSRCNVGLGQFKDSEEMLKRAIAWLGPPGSINAG